ncbi:hypothetical protein ACMFMG_010705 [Clarireedia jacksonii]
MDSILTEEGGTGYDVYFELPEDKNKITDLSEQVKKVLDTPLNMDLAKNKPELIEAAIKGLTSSYDHSKFQGINAGSLSEEDWGVVHRNTHYLNGHRVVFTNGEDGTRTFKRIDKAPYSGRPTRGINTASSEIR